MFAPYGGNESKNGDRFCADGGVFLFHRKKLGKGIQGSQIDLVMKRADRVTNLFEMKYSQDCYMVTGSDDEALRRKRYDYQRVMGTRNTTYITLVTPYGIIQNSYAGNLDSVLTGDDLFYNTNPA